MHTRTNQLAKAVKKHGYFVLLQRYVNETDPLHLQFKFTLKCGLAATIAILLAYSSLPRLLIWLVMPTVFNMFASIGYTRSNRLFTQVLCGLIMAVCAGIAAYFCRQTFIYLPYIFALSMLTFYLSRRSPPIAICALLILIYTVFNGSFPADLADSLERTYAALVGLLLAIIITYSIRPYKPTQELRENIQEIFLQLSTYLKFSIKDALRGNYHRHLQYKSKLKILKSLQYCFSILSNYPHEELAKLLQFQKQLFLQITSLSDILGFPNNIFSISAEGVFLEHFLRELPDNISHFSPQHSHALHEHLITKTSADLNSDVSSLNYILQQTLTTIYALTEFLQKYPLGKP